MAFHSLEEIQKSCREKNVLFWRAVTFRRYGRSICDRDGVNAVDAADVDSDEISE